MLMVLADACGGAGSGAPWWPWDDGGRHDRWVDGLASLPTIIACQVSAGPQKSCQPPCFISYRKNWYWNSRAFLLGQKWVTHKFPRLAITSPKRHLMSNPSLVNNHKYHLEHFGHLNHAHSTKIDRVKFLKLPFLTSAGTEFFVVYLVSYITVICICITGTDQEENRKIVLGGCPPFQSTIVFNRQ